MTTTPSIAIIGGGLAGLAAAEAARRHGLDVDVFEQAERLGGRAGSFVEPFGERLVDFSQHAAMGCCTNFLDFCRRTGVDGCFRRERSLSFLGPDNRLCRFIPSRWLPAPLHLSSGLKNLNFLSSSERKGIGRAMMKLARIDELLAIERKTAFRDWLCEQNQTKNAVDHFWSIIVQGALAETVENASLSAAKKVFVDGFLASRSAGELILPSIPLGEIFDGRVGNHLAERGVKLHRRRRVMWIEAGENSELSLILAEGETRTFDAIVLAVPWHQAEGLFPPELLEELPELKNAQKLQPGGITAVHLWFDHPITEFPHAVLVGKLSQWIFRCASKGKSESEHSDLAFYQVVISAAHRLAAMEKEALLDQVLAELAEAFPDFTSAKLLHSRVVKQPQAVFSMIPGVENYRPAQKTSFENLFLAGDWTATGWPATMEGAVRSGYLAAEALLESLGRPQKILVPNLPRGFVARKLLGK